MSIEIWIGFVFAAILVLIMPGPTVILIVSQAIAHGRKAVPALVAGQTLGDLTAMSLSLLGMGAVMASSAALFSALKWIGAVYLICLGIKLWRSGSKKKSSAILETESSHRSLFQSAYVVTALNPKSIAFFVAFLPQFVSPQNPVFPQLAALGATFLFFAGLNAALYGLFAGRLRDAMQHAGVRRWFNRCGASALIGAGVFTAAMQRSS